MRTSHNYVTGNDNESIIADFNFSIQPQANKNKDDTSLLKDTVSFFSVIKNKKMVMNIRDDTIMNSKSNDEGLDITKMVDLPSWLEV